MSSRRRLASLLRTLAAPLLLLPLCACSWTQFWTPAPASVNPEVSQRHELLADMYQRAGRPDLAVASYEKALSLREPEPGLLVKFGRSLLMLNRPEEALSAYERTLALSPDSTLALRGAGESLLRLNRLDEAEARLRQSIALVPHNWRGRCLLGLVLDSKGAHEEAAREYAKALAAPGSAAGRLDLLNNLGMAQAETGDVEAGVRTLLLALSVGDAPERVSNNLGVLLVRLGRKDQAMAAFRLAGDDPRALNNMGYALLLAGEPEAAQALFEKALQASPAYYGQADANLMQATLAASSEHETAPPARRRMPVRLLAPGVLPDL